MGYITGYITGYDHPITLKVLQELVPQLKKQGVQFVNVSELTR